MTAAELALLTELVECTKTLIARLNDVRPRIPIGSAACDSLDAKLAAVVAE